MDGDDDTLGREANRATIRSAWYAKVGIVLAVATLLWAIFSDVVLSGEGSAPATQQPPTVTTGAETATEDAETSAPQSEADDESAATVDGFVGYFKQAASDTGQWRSHQAIWQLIVWWVAAAAIYLWLINGRMLLPTFRTGVVMLTAYLLVFWPSLSALGAGLALGGTLLIILGLVVSEGF